MALTGENALSRANAEGEGRASANVGAVRFEVDKGCEAVFEKVASEIALTIRVNEEAYAHLVCSPWDLEGLAVGFLASSHVVRTVEDILSVHVDKAAGEVRVGCATHRAPVAYEGDGETFGVRTDALPAPVDEGFSIEGDQLAALVRFVSSRTQTFQRMIGVHSGLVIGGGEELAFHEDVSRNNVLDRILGQCILDGVSLDDKIIAFSGRMSAMVVRKVAAMGVPILLSAKAPTSLGTDMAEELGVTLITFARDGSSCTIYSHSERVVGDCSIARDRTL